jgi:hypothetical protein
MGYLIKPAGESDIVKFETLIKAADMQQLNSAPYNLTPTQKAGFIFVPTICFIQVNGTTAYNTFNHMWIYQDGGGVVYNSTFGRTAASFLAPSSLCSFIVNIEHGLTPTNKFGNRTIANRDFLIAMDTDDLSGDGDGIVTMKGFYQPIFT